MKKLPVLALGVFLIAGLAFGGLAKNYFKEAQELEQKGFYKEAKALLLKALNEKPKTSLKFDILLELADIEYDQLNEPEEALKHVMEAKALYPENHRKMDGVYYRLGLIYEKLGKYVDAAKSFEIVATKYRKSKYYDSALKGVERAFKKNFKEYVAIADDEPITRIEFDERLQQVPPFFRAQYETEEGKRKLLDRMIDEILMYKEAEALKLYLDGDVVKQLMDARKKILQTALYKKLVRDAVKVSDKEIKRYYLSHKKDYKLPPKATYKKVVVKTKEEALEVIDLYKKGVPFDSLIVKKSIEKVKTGEFAKTIVPEAKPKEISNVVFKLKEGEISKPIPLSDSTFAVVLVLKREPAKLRPLEDVRDQIERLLKRKKESKKFEELRKKLRKKYGVKYEEDIKAEMRKYGVKEGGTKESK